MCISDKNNNFCMLEKFVRKVSSLLYIDVHMLLVRENKKDVAYMQATSK